MSGLFLRFASAEFFSALPGDCESRASTSCTSGAETTGAILSIS